MNRVGANLVALAMALTGCGEEARISASAVLAPPLAPSMLTVTVRDRDREIEWTAAAFRVTPANATPSTPEATLGTSGPDLPVAFRLESAGAVLSAGTVTLPRRRDWRWNVTVQSATTDPNLECFGCVGSQAFPLAAEYRAPDRDSIWVVWGGNSISDPVIY
jgi:hypothetical protein